MYSLQTVRDGVKDTSFKAKAKTKDFKIVLEDSNTADSVGDNISIKYEDGRQEPNVVIA